MVGGDAVPPLRAQVPHGHWRTMTFLAALRHDRIAAPCVVDGPINGESFRAYVEQMLVPTLQPGDIVVMDNLGSHKAQAIRKAIRAAGARLVFLPPYSPDLNPIVRSSQSSKSCSARPRSAPLKVSGAGSATFSSTSPHRNAQTICATLDMLQSKSERL